MDVPHAERTLIETASSDALYTTPQNLNAKPKKPPPPVKEPVAHRTSFFNLPREVRDMVYDYYWLANPGLKASSTSFHGLILQLRYHGQYEMLLGAIGYEKPDNIGGSYPTWLLASKQLLTEALHQFASKAAWFWGDAPLERHPHDFRASNILDISQIHDMILCVETLDYAQDFEVPWGALQTFAHALSLDQTHGAGVRQLRIVGWSCFLPHDGDFRGRALFIARRIVHIFNAVDLQTLELDICNRWTDRRRILYEVVGRGKDTSLVVRKDKRRGFPLRCNIVRPNGRGYWGNDEAE